MDFSTIMKKWLFQNFDWGILKDIKHFDVSGEKGAFEGAGYPSVIFILKKGARALKSNEPLRKFL